MIAEKIANSNTPYPEPEKFSQHIRRQCRLRHKSRRFPTQITINDVDCTLKWGIFAQSAHRVDCTCAGRKINKVAVDEWAGWVLIPHNYRRDYGPEFLEELENELRAIVAGEGAQDG